MSTIEIPLTKGHVAIVDEQDADLAQFKWYVAMMNDLHYAERYAPEADGRKIVSMHRTILERIISRPLVKGEVCDHIDGNVLNNRRSNLRLATHQQNMRNKKRSRNNTTGYKGVRWYAPLSKYNARITVNNKCIHLGYFSNAEEAHEAYKQAAVKYFGEFARFE